MQRWIVAGDGESRRVGMAADHRDLVSGRNAGGLRDARRLAEQAGRLVGEDDLDRAVAGDGAGGKREGSLERVERRLFTLAERHRQLKATLAVDCGRSSPKQR